MEAAIFAAQIEALVGTCALSVATDLTSIGVLGDRLRFAGSVLARLARTAVCVGGAGDRWASSRGVNALLLPAAHIRTAVARGAALVFVAGLSTAVAFGGADADIRRTTAIFGFGARLTKSRHKGHLARFAGLGGCVAGKTTAAIGLLGAVEARIRRADRRHIVGGEVAFVGVGPKRADARCGVIHQRARKLAVPKADGMAEFV